MNGGTAPAWELRALWRAVKSEYRFWSVKERSGKRREILYTVCRFGVVAVEAVGTEISTFEAIAMGYYGIAIVVQRM